jgi:heme A synthase
VNRLVRLGWLTLGWNVVVILWGAVVRSTGSGAGCGRSWPTCQGEIVPELRGATAVEFGHRVVSGVALVLVGVLVVQVFRRLARGPVRKAAALSGVAIVVESMIGAMIVFYEWVADDASVARVISVPLHLVNTLFLLAALTATVFLLSAGSHPVETGERPWLLAIGAGMVVIAATGAVTALADTLFPKDGFTIAGVFDVVASEHFLTELRVIHPIVAIVVGVVAAGWAWRRPNRAARVVVWVVGVQLVAGFANVWLGTPMWLSVLHLLAADVLWIAWVWLGMERSTRGDPAPRAGTVAVGRSG